MYGAQKRSVVCMASHLGLLDSWTWKAFPRPSCQLIQTSIFAAAVPVTEKGSLACLHSVMLRHPLDVQSRLHTFTLPSSLGHSLTKVFPCHRSSSFGNCLVLAWWPPHAAGAAFFTGELKRLNRILMHYANDVPFWIFSSSSGRVANQVLKRP